MPFKEKNSVESEEFDNSTSGDAIKDYFNSFLPVFEENLKNQSRFDDMCDTSIDLNSLPIEVAVAKEKSPNKKIVSQQPKQSRQQQHDLQLQQQMTSLDKKTNQRQLVEKPQYQVAKTKELDLGQLDFISNELARKSAYGIQLANIMADGLKQSNGPFLYNLFMEEKFNDINFIPIVRMNSSNTPYIELLFKSSSSDEDPFTQLTTYCIIHMTQSKFITEQVREIISKQQRIHHNQKQNLQPRQQHQKQQPMICSTPIRSSSCTVKRPVSQSEPSKKQAAVLQPVTKRQVPSPKQNLELNNKKPLPTEPENKTPTKNYFTSSKELITKKQPTSEPNASKRASLLRACKLNKQQYSFR